MKRGLAGSGLVERFSDEELAREAQGGSSAAFESLVGRYRTVLMRHVQRRVHCSHEAEDIVQETLLRVSRNLHRYDSGRPLLPWLLTIATRVAITQSRRRAVGTRGLAADVWAEQADEHAGPQEEVSQAELTAMLWAAIGHHLSPRQHLVIWLRYGRGYSVAEVAAECDLTRLHVKVLLHRARRRLLKCGCIKKLIAPA